MFSLIVALIVIFFFNKFAKRKQEEEGKQYPKFLISLGIFINFASHIIYDWWC